MTESVSEGVGALASHRAAMVQKGMLAERRRRKLRNEVLGLVCFRLCAGLEVTMRDDPAVASLLDAVVDRRLDPATAARKILADHHAIERRQP
jgi:LAO/AO transport system kinase